MSDTLNERLYEIVKKYENAEDLTDREMNIIKLMLIRELKLKNTD
jgi:hypothetical protein